MEEVYLKKASSPSISENINFASFFDNYSKIIACSRTTAKGSTTLKSLLKVDEEQFQNLIKSCNAQVLNCSRYMSKPKTLPPGFRKGFKLHELPTDMTHLKSLNHIRNRTQLEKDTNKAFLKYAGQVTLDPQVKLEQENLFGNLEPYKEYLLTIRVFMPCYHRTRQGKKAVIPKVSQEFIVPGRMTLIKLRDRIACQEDYQDVSPDISNDPLATTELRSGEKYKSAMFYIGNIFYVDTREESNEDYSETIREWALLKNLPIGETFRMEEATISLIHARLGYPYVYIHQGCCEHLLMITDARLLHSRDIRCLNDYPVMISFSILKGKFCDICCARSAKYIICGSESLMHDNSYLCTKCMLLYNYAGTTKLSNFKMFKYTDRIAIL